MKLISTLLAPLLALGLFGAAPFAGPTPDLPPLKETMLGMNSGMAIDARETSGPAAELLLQHFNQVVPENHFKPEAWFDGMWNFERIGQGSVNMRLHPQARSILEFAVANDLDVFGHVLIWHSQIPDWFFQDAAGNWLTGDSGRAELLRRMDNFIYNQAVLITDEFGLFGSPTNPVVAWEVVNEVVSNNNFDAAGLRPSRWMQIIGADFVDYAFLKADQYLNHEFAEPGFDRPISLWINDYNTETMDKRARMLTVVNGLLERGVPLDGVGQQFHITMGTPVAALREALLDFADLPVMQAVTELDITMSSPAFGEAQLETQGHRYLEIFNLFREHQPAVGDLAFVTVWGLTDGRSWRSELAPVLFFADLTPKPAFWGAVGDLARLGALRGEAYAFGGAFSQAWAAANPGAAFADAAWFNTPPNELTDGVGDFRARWNPQELLLLVNTVAGVDHLAVNLNGEVISVNLDQRRISEVLGITLVDEVFVTGSDASAIKHVSDDGSIQVILSIPYPAAAEGEQAELDVRVFSEGIDLGGWNSPGNLGTVNLVEPLSFTQALEAERAPVFQATDSLWQSGLPIRTEVLQSGEPGGATAIVHTLWYGDTLYVRFDVTDPDIDTSASDPWEQDSVEVFLDLGNAKSGPLREWHDIQVRVNADGVVTFGAGELGRQQQRVTETAVTWTDTGYIVELAIGLWTINEHQSRVEYGGIGSVQGFDVQVNDATGGVRTSVHSWANPTLNGYQDTSRWGVIELVDEATATAPSAPLAESRGLAALPVIPFLVTIAAIGLLALLWVARHRGQVSLRRIDDELPSLGNSDGISDTD